MTDEIARSLSADINVEVQIGNLRFNCSTTRSTPGFANMLSVTVLLSAAAAIVSIYFYKYFLYPVFLSPLSQIPNAHFTASFSSLWIIRVRSKSIENHTLLSCHEKYGPVIRVSPNEISINCVDNGIRTVYAGGFEKTDWYPKSFGNYKYYSLIDFEVPSSLNSIAYRICFPLLRANHIRSGSE